MRLEGQVQVLILYLTVQEQGAYFTCRTASGMTGIQMEIKESWDCYAVHIEEKSIGN